jgi:hypothetical protein
LSPDVFKWLIDNGYIAIYTSEKTTKDGSRKWTDHEIAFPVFRSVNWTAWPIESEIEFLGMHLKWIKDSENSGWRYEPKGQGIASEPYLIGNLTKAELVIIAESTWDVIAFLDLYQLYQKNLPWCAIATRGASNAGRIAADSFKSDATILLLMQNDPANQMWHKHLPRTVIERGHLATPPPGIKDLNDWMKEASPAEIKKTLAHQNEE